MGARRLVGPKGTCVSVGSVSQGYDGGSGDGDYEKAEQLPEQTHCFFFMPNGEKEPEWPQLLAETIDAISTGALKIMMDPECGTFPVGVEGVYPAQARMRSGQNVGKIYARISE